MGLLLLSPIEARQGGRAGDKNGKSKMLIMGALSAFYFFFLFFKTAYV